MAQKPQIIDITRSYVPGDPNAFPENLISTQSQDGEEKAPPVSPFEGYNFMPTPYGYKSYFGTTARLNVPVVPARAQFILSYQSGEYVNNLIALCEDGIWIIDPTSSANTWKPVVTHTFNTAVFEEWTWCIIENSLYCYKQGHANVYHTSDVNDVPNGLGISIVATTPTFLNMAGQMGIFKAGTRLGFWDSANSVSWSSNLDLNDVTPSLENLAGNTIFGAVIGRITHIREHGEGFIIYSTKSIVGVSFDASSNMLWDSHTISNVCGVAVGREVTQGSSNSEHFAYTTAGMYRIGGYNGLTKQHEFQQVAIELSDLLKEYQLPVYLDCMEGRYLYLHCIDDRYIDGIVSFENGYVGSYKTRIDWYIPSNTDAAPTQVLTLGQFLDMIMQELGGITPSKHTRTDNRKWIPLFNVTLDQMMSGYQAHWERNKPGQNIGSRLPYETEEPTLAAAIATATFNASYINSKLSPDIPASPPDAYRVGNLRGFTNVRAFPDAPLADYYLNNLMLSYDQQSEWDDFTAHQSANIDGILSTSSIVTTTYVSSTPAEASSNSSVVLGSFLTGEGNQEWLTTEGPTQFAAKEIILRKTFNKKCEITENVATNASSVLVNAAAWSATVGFVTGTSEPSSPTWGTTAVTWGTAEAVSNVSAADVHNVALSMLKGFTVSSWKYSAPFGYFRWTWSVYTPMIYAGIATCKVEIWEITDVNGYNMTPILKSTQYNAGAHGGVGAINAISSYYNITKTVSTYYSKNIVPTAGGYSQYRAVITRWDLLEPVVYGGWKLILSVPAEAMTPKVWNNHYPEDRGDRIQQYSKYAGLAGADLYNSIIADYNVYIANYNKSLQEPIGNGLVGYSGEKIVSKPYIFTYPGATFLLQTGSPVAVYPEFKGAFVFDLSLKKWGKLKADYNIVFPFSALNSTDSGVIPYDNFGMNCGILLSADRSISLLDAKPADSWIKYGKIGYYRLGMTIVHEVKAMFRSLSSGSLTIDSSLDGRNVDLPVKYKQSFDMVSACTVYPDVNGRWHTVKIEGNYDLQYLEVRGTIAGRR